MPNPQFDVIFAADRAIIRPISEANYKTGWNHLGSNNVITDDHDYVMRLQDEKMKWLYDAIGFSASNNINLPDDNTIDVGSTYNVVMGGAGSDVSGGSQNTLMGTYGATIVGAQNTLFVAGGTTVTGQGNVVFRSFGANVTGDDNFLFNTAATLTGIDSCFFVSANGVSTAGSNSDTAVMNSSGASLTDTDGCLVYGSPSVTMNAADNSGVMFTTGSCVITASSASVIESSVASVINDSSRSHILSSNQCTVDGFDNVTIVSSQNVIARKSNTLVLGYGLSAPSTANIKIELDAETGNAAYTGIIDAAGFTVGGVPIGGSTRLDNLTATTNPTVNDDSGDGYSPLSNWVNTVTGEIFTAITVAPGAANWQLATLTLDNLGNMALVNGTTIGQNLVTLANPGAIRFPRFNADNTVSSLDASGFRTAIGLGSAAVLTADMTASNSSVVQRTAAGNVVTNRMEATVGASDITIGVGESIAQMWVSGSANPYLFGRLGFGTVANYLKSDYGMATVDGDGNLYWTRTGAPVKRLQLPFSGAGSGAALQHSTVNSATVVNVVPNGTSTIARLAVLSAETATDAHSISIGVTSTEAKLESSATGSGTYRPLNIYTNGVIAASIALDGSLNLAKNGAKITGQMSSATLSDNVTLQSNVTNGLTVFNIAPNGTSVVSGFNIASASDLANTGYLGISSQTGDYRISVGQLGSGVLKPLSIRMGATTAQIISTVGDVGIGVASPTTECKLQVSNGIKLGNTANATATVLDWYEEGTFTPVVVGITSAGSGTYTTQEGKYTRIGNIVYFNIVVNWTAHTGTGDIRIDGLPFTSASTNTGPVSVYYDSLTVGAGKQLTTFVPVNAAHVRLVASDPSGAAAVNVAMDTSANLRLSGFYFV